LIACQPTQGPGRVCRRRSSILRSRRGIARGRPRFAASLWRAWLALCATFFDEGLAGLVERACSAPILQALFAQEVARACRRSCNILRVSYGISRHQSSGHALDLTHRDNPTGFRSSGSINAGSAVSRFCAGRRSTHSSALTPVSWVGSKRDLRAWYPMFLFR